MELSTRIELNDKAFRDVEQHGVWAERRIMLAARRATAKEAERVKNDIRNRHAGLRMGRLLMAIGSSSDEKKNTYRQTARGFSVSGNVHIRSRSERTVGAIISVTEGAEITPRTARWLWIATDEIPKFVGAGRSRSRMTPALYRSEGYETKIGPLGLVKSINGNPLLVVKNATVSEGGKPRSAKARTKSGGVRKGYRAKEFIVAFIGIPRTSRAALVNVTAFMNMALGRLPATFEAELRKEIR